VLLPELLPKPLWRDKEACGSLGRGLTKSPIK
jgi:hypothetical protein